MLSRTADITHGFCISHGEISSSTRNLLFRLAVVAQICGLFRPLPLSPDENSLSKFPFLSFPFPFLSLLFSLLFFSLSFFSFSFPRRGLTQFHYPRRMIPSRGIEGSASGKGKGKSTIPALLYSFYPACC